MGRCKVTKGDFMLKSTMNNGHGEGDFPKLMICKTDTLSLVVLFENENKGVVVHTNSSVRYVGEISYSLNVDNFEDFHGTITLTA